MKWLKSENGIRDFIFLGMLIAIVSAIIDRNGELYEQQLKNLYAVHEVNPDFAKNVRQATRQLDTISELMPAAEMDAALTEKITSLKTELATIKEEYVTNSPALLALGPIGTTSIVLKEAELEKKLLKTLNEINTVIVSLVPHRPGTTMPLISDPAPTIELALGNNAQALNQLVA